MAAAAPIMSATAHDRDRNRHGVDSSSGSNRSSRSPIPLSGTLRLLRRAGQVLRSGRVLQPHRKHSRNRQDHGPTQKVPSARTDRTFAESYCPRPKAPFQANERPALIPGESPMLVDLHALQNAMYGNLVTTVWAS